VRSLEFDAAAFEDLAWWVETDRQQALRIVRLIRDIQRDPFTGTGKPEPLRHELKGCWSRRINAEHRLVYQVLDAKIRILACRYHY
jgi:toxin YoeB